MPSVNIMYRYIDTPDRVTPLLNTLMYSVTLKCHGLNFLQVFPVNLFRERNIFNEKFMADITYKYLTLLQIDTCN